MKTRILSIMLVLAMMLTTFAMLVSSADAVPNYPFTDVPEWAIGVVNTVYEKGIMNGTGDTTFGPNGSFTREQIAATLYRISGATTTATVEELSAIFTDASKVSSWAVKEVKWAYERGITTGIKDGEGLKFDPQGTLTREQAAAMIMRYIADMGISVPTDNNTAIKDLDKVSSWALDNVKASIAAGIITGDQNGYFNPGGATNRISAAAMLARIPDAKKGVVLRDYKIPTQDVNDPDADSLGLITPNGTTFLEDIKISKATTITDGSSKNQFTATGSGVHGWHESRIVRSEYGTYVVFSQDERMGDKYEAYSGGYNAVVWGKFYLVKITNNGFEKMLEGEYPVVSGSCAPNVLAGEDGMIYITNFTDDKDTYYGSLDRNQNPPFTREAAFLTVYEFDTKTDELVTKSHDIIDFDVIGVHGYGYYQPILDTINGKIYALFTGGEVPGYLSWFIYDMDTHTWEKENYIVETKHRNAYFHAYADGNGGIFFVSQANPPYHAVEAEYGNTFKFATQGYLFHAINLYSIPNMYEEKVELKKAIYDPDYTNRKKFPEIGNNGGLPVIESSHVAHYTEGTTYLDSSGYLYVIYKYTDPSTTSYSFAVYDTNNDFKSVRSGKLSLMMTSSDKISNARYQFAISESLDGDVYLVAINTMPTQATMEIYKFDLSASKINTPMIVDSSGKAAHVVLSYTGTRGAVKHDRLSYTSSRNSSIQDNVLGMLSYVSSADKTRSTSLKAEGFDKDDYSTVCWSGGFQTYELFYYAIEWPSN